VTGLASREHPSAIAARFADGYMHPGLERDAERLGKAYLELEFDYSRLVGVRSGSVPPPSSASLEALCYSLAQQIDLLASAAVNAAAVMRGLMSDPAVTRHTDLTPEIDAIETALNGVELRG
jgi:hypothetical protein